MSLTMSFNDNVKDLTFLRPDRVSVGYVFSRNLAAARHVIDKVARCHDLSETNRPIAQA